MIIGYDMMGVRPYSAATASITNASYVEVRNCIVDEIELQTTLDDDKAKDKWGNGTVLLATFNGDLEAGNISMRGNAIEKLRIKRRKLSDMNFKTLKELPFHPAPTQIIYDDYTVSSNIDYEYIVAPVDSTGIEGIMTAVAIKPKFDGWWIVDPDDPEKYNFQFLYNLDDVSITVDEDRTELSTFSKYPKVYYGQKYARKGSLASLFIPEGYDAKEKYEHLVQMINIKKPYILKDSYGRNFRVDISSPRETIQSRLAGLTKVQIDWVEVGEVDD
ncbi:hypothetical protein [Paenibacillus chitinolyticus]|uniref:hypothetical protein n=1 Tax=Paenibacillus chitinolyticus TaxID=79263 RepID=UPI003D01A00B